MTRDEGPHRDLFAQPGRALTSRDARFRADPHETYDAMRAAVEPVSSADYGCRIFTDFERVHSLLKHKSLSVDASLSRDGSYMRSAAGTGVKESVGDAAYEPPLVLLDDPAHRNIRQRVSRAFNPGVVEAMRPRIETLTHNLLAALGDQQQIDFVKDFAGPLPTMVILDMLGMPVARADDFKRWSAHRPGDDLISRMLVGEHGEDTAERLSELQIISLCTQLMVAGNVTTTDLIGNGMFALLTHPDQLAWLRARPSELENAVEEMLRFDCPITETARIPVTDTGISGCSVKQGETLMLSLAAANHDPDQFDAPHKLNLKREISQHVAFGSGIHVCLGAPLARLETAIAFRQFLTRYTTIELNPDQEPERRHLPFFRGFETLPLRVAG